MFQGWLWWWCWCLQTIPYLYNCAPGISAPPLGIVISYHPSASGLDTITVTKKYGSYLEMQYNTNYFQMEFVSQLLSLLLSVKLLKITFNPKSLCTNPPNSLAYMHLPGNYSSERPNTNISGQYAQDHWNWTMNITSYPNVICMLDSVTSYRCSFDRKKEENK